MKKLFIILISGYQKFSRAIVPRSCRYYPSCSSYAKESIEKFGVFKGSLKALLRLLRCSPLFRGGYDPVR